MKLITYKQPTAKEIKHLELTNLIISNYQNKIEKAFEINAKFLESLLSDNEIDSNEFESLMRCNRKASIIY